VARGQRLEPRHLDKVRRLHSPRRWTVRVRQGLLHRLCALRVSARLHRPAEAKPKYHARVCSELTIMLRTSTASHASTSASVYVFGIQFTASHSARRFYFRAGLDRYVWIHGMICGYLHPTFENWLRAIDDKGAAVRRTIRAAIGAAAVLIMVAWYNTIYILPKLEYNQVHPYTSWIPITAFLILRNITPTLRLKSLGLYGWLGCITLETYVLCVPCIIYYRGQTIVWPSFVLQPVLPVVVSPWMITCLDSLICPQRLLATPWIQAIPYVAPVQGSQLPANISPLTPPRVSAGQFYGRDIALHLLGAPPVQDDGPAQRRHDSTRRRRIVAPKPDHVGSGCRPVSYTHFRAHET